jgi:hypothetical protein
VNNAMSIRPVVALKDSAAQMLNNSNVVMTPKRLLDMSPSEQRMKSQHSGVKQFQASAPKFTKHQPHHSMSNSFYLEKKNDPLDFSMRGTGLNFNI